MFFDFFIGIIGGTVKVIPEHFTIVDKMRDTLRMSVFDSLERKNDPCKSDSPRFYPF